MTETSHNTFRDILAEENPEALLWDGFDEALIGIVRRACHPPQALYSAEKCVTILASKGLTIEESREYLDFNTFCAYLGEHTPYFVESEAC